MISKETFLAALEEIDNAILATLPELEECSFQFSERFERKMRSIIRRGNHPIMYKALQQVACMLLVLLMLFSSVMIFSTDARAVVIGWIKEQYDTFYHYFFPAESKTSEKEEYTLGWVPDGYFLLDSYADETGANIVYIDNSNQFLQFSYSYGGRINSIFADGETYEHQQFKLDNNIADLYLSTVEGISSGVVWIDSRDETLFCISAILDKDELIMIAENVIKK